MKKHRKVNVSVTENVQHTYIKKTQTQKSIRSIQQKNQWKTFALF